MKNCFLVRSRFRVLLCSFALSVAASALANYTPQDLRSTASYSLADATFNWEVLSGLLDSGGTSANRKIVTLPAGNFYIQIPAAYMGLTIKSYTTLQGVRNKVADRTQVGTGTKLIFLNTPRAGHINDAYPAPISVTDGTVATSVTIQNLIITGTFDYSGPGAAIIVGSCTALTIAHVDIDGGGYGKCHGILIDDLNASALRTNVTIDDCLFTRCEFGIFSRNGFKGTASAWTISNSVFFQNHGDDIELNSPAAAESPASLNASTGLYDYTEYGSGTWSDVAIIGCTFKQNLYGFDDSGSRDPAHRLYYKINGVVQHDSSGVAVYLVDKSFAGFGVGLSGKSSGMLVTQNTFEDYWDEAVHVENGCSNSAITRNALTSCRQGMKISAWSNNTHDISISQNSVGGVLGSGNDWGIQLVDAGEKTDHLNKAFHNNYPVNMLVIGNTISNFDKGVVSGPSSATSLIASNYVKSCSVGINGSASMRIKENTLLNCTAAYEFSGTINCGYNTLIGSPTSYAFIVPSSQTDFHRASNGDVFWLDASTGVVSRWLMNNSILSPATTVGVVSAPWQIAGTGDFDADGRIDILWRNATTGLVSEWLMKSTGISYVDIDTISVSWQIAGTGDLNSDGKTDILWKNTSSGVVSVWQTSGTGFTYPDIGVASSSWRIVGTGDFNNDGQIDILWQNTATGTLSRWLMGNPIQYVDIDAVSPNWVITQ